MSKKALLAICVAVLIPLVSYYLVKYASDDAISMPPRYFYDSVAVKMKDGKEYTDTIWHRARNFELTNQLGQQVSLDQIKGRIIVVDYFFTHCPSICPTLTHNIKQLQDGLKLKDNMKGVDTTFVQFLSFSVDPERDSVPVLKKYGDRFGVNPDVWWLLTGPKKTIYDFALTELKLGLQDGEGVDSAFIHTQKLALLDRDHVVRGYYDGLDSASLSKMARDVVFLMLEKDRHAKSEFLTELAKIWPVFVIAVIAVFLFVLFNKKSKY